MSTRRYYVEKNPKGEIIGKVETGVGTEAFVTTPVSALVSGGITPQTVAIPKPVDRSYTTVNRTYNLSRNGRLNLPNLSFVDYLRRTDFPLSSLLTRQDYFSHQGVLPGEESDESVWRRAYFELSGGALGTLEGSRPFFLATTQQVLNQLAATSMGINKAVPFVVTNFETCYPLFPTSQAGVESAYGSLSQTIVIEQEGARKGQTLTLLQAWNEGMSFFHAEEAIRFTNRHVAITLWLKALVPGAKVANGDGSNVYYQRTPVFDYDNVYDSYASGTNPGNFFFTTTANQPTLSAGGLTVTPAGKKFWEVQDWINNYIYPGSHILPAADFDALATAGPTAYGTVWPKLKPDVGRYDASIVAYDYINRKKLPGKPYTLQTHYRDENGYVKEGTTTTSKFFSQLSDEAVCPPWHHYAVGAWTAFLGQSKDDRLTVWRTFRVFPAGGSSGPGSPDYVYDRPHADREAYDAGLSAVGKFREYLGGAARRIYHHDLYIKYDRAGASWGPSATASGNYYKRSIRDTVFANNPSDRRTKAVIGVRTLVKNGAVWALVIGTNWGQNSDDTTTFDLLLRSADIPELTADVELSGLTIAGYGVLLAEFCLEPAKLLSVVGSTPAPVTPTGVDPDFDYFGFPWSVPTAATAPTNTVSITSGNLTVQLRSDYGGGIVGVFWNGSSNLINNHDLGRQLASVFYSDPTPFSPAGWFKPEVWKDFAMNLNRVGDFANNPAQVLAYAYDAATGTHYYKTRMVNFPTIRQNNSEPRFLSGSVIETWYRPLPGGVVRIWERIVSNRNDDAAVARNLDGSLVRSRGKVHEFPAGYINDAFAILSYDNGSGIQTRNLNNPAEEVQSMPVNNNWFHIGNGTTGFGIVGRHIAGVTGQMHPPGDLTATGGVDGLRSTYVCNHYGMNPDPVGTIYLCWDIKGGTPSEVKSYAEGLTQIRPASNTPDYSFATHRRGFWTQNATLNDEATAGKLVVTHLNQQARLYSPQREFLASGVTTMYIRMRNNSPVTALRFNWRRVGQTEGDSAGQIIDFNCPNDGNYHTIALTVGTVGSWTGKIMYTLIGQQVAPENSPVSGRSWEVLYWGKTNPTP